jgi:4-hydroxy-2-oxoheptanedioate aldolase
MRENTAKRAWREGRTTYGAWLQLPDSFASEAMAHQGFDWVCIDMQHGAVDYQTALGMLQAISTTDTIPFVRVPWNEPGIIGKMLDAGAYGVVIPMVNSHAEAEAAVGACLYQPAGYRSFGPVRAAYYGGADYAGHANDEIACIPMIETKPAIEQLDDILSVPGIAAVYVGPADLSLTLGLPPGMDNDAPEFDEALKTIVDSCARHGITPGIHSNASLAAKRAAQGFKMITVSSDLGAMARGAAQDLHSVREAGESGQPVYG